MKDETEKVGIGLILALKYGDVFTIDVCGERIDFTVLEPKGRGIRIALKADKDRVKITRPFYREKQK